MPEYRELSGVISMDSISGNTWAKGQIITRYQLPREAWEYVPDKFALKQPIEELEHLALQKSLSFTSPGLAYAQTIWNNQLDPFQSIMGLSYAMSGSVIAGVLGQIRTHLVDLIADLTADTPLSELPRKDQVDAAVGQYLSQPHAVYNTTINEANGPVAVGNRRRGDHRRHFRSGRDPLRTPLRLPAGQTQERASEMRGGGLRRLRRPHEPLRHGLAGAIRTAQPLLLEAR